MDANNLTLRNWAQPHWRHEPTRLSVAAPSYKIFNELHVLTHFGEDRREFLLGNGKDRVGGVQRAVDDLNVLRRSSLAHRRKLSPRDVNGHRSDSATGHTQNQSELDLRHADDINIGDTGSVMRAAGNGIELAQMKFGLPPSSPKGGPVFNYRSESRKFDKSKRCLIPASAFFEFTGTKISEG